MRTMFIFIRFLVFKFKKKKVTNCFTNLNSTNEGNLVHDEANFLGHIDIQRFCLGVLRSQDLLMSGE